MKRTAIGGGPLVNWSVKCLQQEQEERERGTERDREERETHRDREEREKHRERERDTHTQRESTKGKSSSSK